MTGWLFIPRFGEFVVKIPGSIFNEQEDGDEIDDKEKKVSNPKVIKEAQERGDQQESHGEEKGNSITPGEEKFQCEQDASHDQ